METFDPDRLAPILGIGGILTPAQKAQLFEALIGAYFLETSYEKTKELVVKHFNVDEIIKNLLNTPWGAKHPKSYMEEKLKQMGYESKYSCMNKGSQNNPKFVCTLEIFKNDELVDSITSDHFPRKKDAETDAAKKLSIKWKEEGRF